MTGFVTGIVKREKFPSISKLAQDGELSFVNLSNGSVAFAISNANSMQQDGFLAGYVVDPERSIVSFSDVQTSRPLLEGSHVRLLIGARSAEVVGDTLGNYPWFYSVGDGFLIASSSFLAACYCLKALDVPLTFDEIGVRSRMWGNTLAQQLISDRTYVREIKFATAGDRLSYEYCSGVTKLIRRDWDEYLLGRDSTGLDIYERSALSAVGLLKAFAGLGAKIGLGLSGGRDSRICLALGADLVATGQMYVNSSASHSQDFAVAQNVARWSGFTIGETGGVKSRVFRHDESLVWGSHNLCAYDGLYTANSYRVSNPPLLQIGGHGAGAIKGGYGWRPLSDIGMPTETRTEIQRFFEEHAIDPDSCRASELLFLLFRNPLHSGRALASTELLSRPLGQVPMVRAAHQMAAHRERTARAFTGTSPSGKNRLSRAIGRETAQILNTYLARLDPMLASIPFDVESKNQSLASIDESLSIGNGRIRTDRIEPFNAVGELPSQDGLSTSLLSMASDCGLSGELLSGENVERVMHAGETYANLLGPKEFSRFEAPDFVEKVRLRKAGPEATLYTRLLSLKILEPLFS